MILVVGASGRLGGLVARQLLADGKPVRAMSRVPSSLADLKQLGAEVVPGDQRDPRSLVTACRGIDSIVAATHAFNGGGNNGPRAVDGAGNRNLIDVARSVGVRNLVFTSILHARPDHPVSTFRYKFATEQYLRSSGLSYTILRPAPFMDTWAQIIGEPIVKRGRAIVFGSGKNPINFVSAADVAQVAVMALSDPRAWGQVIEIGGPENITQMRFVKVIEQVTGRMATVQHIPLPMMRLLRVAMRPINPAFSRQILAGIIMDTEDMTFDPAKTLQVFPMRLARLEEVVRSQVANLRAVH